MNAEQIKEYPRTQHIEGSNLQIGDEAKKIPFEQILGKPLIIEEKIDGAQSAISFSSNGELMLQSRGHYLNGGYGERHFNLLKQMANQNMDLLFDVLGDRYIMYGEWMYAKHSIYYNALPSYFMEFDVYDKKESVFLDTPHRNGLLHSLRKIFPAVPVLAKTYGRNSDSIGGYEDLMALVGPSAFVDFYAPSDFIETCVKTRNVLLEKEIKRTDFKDLMEGLYIKVEENGSVTGRYKWVRNSFTQTVFDSKSHWQSRIIVPNKVGEYRHAPMMAGESWEAWKIMMARDLVHDFERRYCDCGNECCAECNYYKSLGV